MTNVQRYRSVIDLVADELRQWDKDDLVGYVVDLELTLLKVSETASFENPSDEEHFNAIVNVILEDVDHLKSRRNL